MGMIGKDQRSKMLFFTAEKNGNFYIRAAANMGISHLKNKRVKNVKLRAASDHLLNSDCDINFDDIFILSKDWQVQFINKKSHWLKSKVVGD